MTSINRPLLLGHRGARLPHIPENTIAAFDLALRAGCDGFELDIRATRDGQMVVTHDPTLCGMEVASGTYAELQQRWQERVVPRLPLTQRRSLAHEQISLPCLQDVLQRYAGRAFLDIEVKVPGLEDAVVRELADSRPARFILSSFLPEVLLEFRRRNDETPLGIICDSARQLAQWPKLPISYVIAHSKLATRELAEELHQHGKKLMVWTVNREDDVRRLASWSVDGIVSDHPEMLARAAADREAQGT